MHLGTKPRRCTSVLVLGHNTTGQHANWLELRRGPQSLSRVDTTLPAVHSRVQCVQMAPRLCFTRALHDLGNLTVERLHRKSVQ